MNGDHDVIEIARQLRYDLTAMQAKVTDLLTMLAALNLPDPSRVICPECGVTVRGPMSLAEHLYVSHDGPEPEHWVEAEAKAKP